MARRLIRRGGLRCATALHARTPLVSPKFAVFDSVNGRSVKSASLERDESRRQDAASTEMQWAALDSNQRLPPCEDGRTSGKPYASSTYHFHGTHVFHGFQG